VRQKIRGTPGEASPGTPGNPLRTPDQGARKIPVLQSCVGTDNTQPAALPQLAALRQELARLKTEVLDRFTRGELAGKELLAGFLLQVNDGRDVLSGLIRQNPANASIPAGTPDARATDVAAGDRRP